MEKHNTATTDKQQKPASRPLADIGNSTAIELTEQELTRVSGGRKAGKTPSE